LAYSYPSVRDEKALARRRLPQLAMSRLHVAANHNYDLTLGHHGAQRAVRLDFSIEPTVNFVAPVSVNVVEIITQ